VRLPHFPSIAKVFITIAIFGAVAVRECPGRAADHTRKASLAGAAIRIEGSVAS
jgi:hypothetical protein